MCNFISICSLLLYGYVVNYDETYDVTYVIIIKRFGVSMEPLWELKSSLACVFNKYLPYKPRATF